LVPSSKKKNQKKKKKKKESTKPIMSYWSVRALGDSGTQRGRIHEEETQDVRIGGPS